MENPSAGAISSSKQITQRHFEEEDEDDEEDEVDEDDEVDDEDEDDCRLHGALTPDF